MNNQELETFQKLDRIEHSGIALKIDLDYVKESIKILSEKLDFILKYLETIKK